MIDLHSHLIPGVDDGATNIEESRAALETLAEQGVRRLVTTPHLDGSLTLQPARLEEYFLRLESPWGSIRTLAEEAFWDVDVSRGTEVMLDVPEPDLSDPRVRLAGTDFVLVEFPYLTIPPRSAEAIYQLRLKGWLPVIAHPERYADAERLLELIEEWKHVGGLLQVNCGSLLGRYGDAALHVSTTLLKTGLVDYLASDYHARGRCSVAECREFLRRAGGEEHVGLLLRENPARLLENEMPEPVPPLRLSSGLWSRISNLWG